jgi:phosphatidylserine/phosphatidylglycerophosphate/cardiolipin synthase-like enzyme
MSLALANVPEPSSSSLFTLGRWLLTLAMLTWATGCASLPSNVSRPESHALGTPEQTALGQLAQLRRGTARADSGFRLLDTVDIALSSRLALIDGAQKTLDLQYYAIHADASTEVILQGLRKAAQRGVRVRVLLDDFNSVGEDAQVLRLAFEPNVELRLFNPIPGSRQSLVGRLLGSLDDVERIQKRMHNKLFIGDNAWGIAGGRNLGDVYFGGGDKQNFVDLDVLAAGRIVRDMSASFDRYWNDKLAYPVQSLLSKEDLEKLRKPEPGASSPQAPEGKPTAAALVPVSAASSGGILPAVSAQQAAAADRPSLDLKTVALVWAPAVLLADKPGKVAPGDDEVDAHETVVDGLLNLMAQAQRDVLIVSPYFVPGKRMMAVFAQLQKRGVRVRVLTNSLASNDAPAAHAGYARYRERLLDLGLELHEMRSDPETAAGLAGSSGGHHGFGLGSGPGGSKSGTSRASLHSKAVMIDGLISVIGSMNLDLRSQLQNSEIALLIRSRALTQQSAALIESTFAHDAYRVERDGHGLVWRAPAGAPFKDTHGEPEASLKLKLLVKVLGPFAPDEML